jgi:hypothetical protein
MTSEPEQRYQSDQPYARRPEGNYYQRRERGFFISTEARPGFITSEFWFTLIGAAALGILAYASDLLGVRWGLGFMTAVLVAYILSRGIAKAGSSDVMMGRSGDRDRDRV